MQFHTITMINEISLSPAAQVRVQKKQRKFLNQVGAPITTSQALELIVEDHADLTALLGVDPGLFGAALDLLNQQGDDHIVNLLLKVIGDASGYWATDTKPEMVPATDFSAVLRTKAAEWDAQQLKF